MYYSVLDYFSPEFKNLVDSPNQLMVVFTNSLPKEDKAVKIEKKISNDRKEHKKHLFMKYFRMEH